MGYGSCGHRSSNFYPRPPRGGRPEAVERRHQAVNISIHALREEGDKMEFQVYAIKDISIHALREEGDRLEEENSRQDRHFYPRPPRGGRHTAAFSMTTMSRFLSTPSARRATGSIPDDAKFKAISIHALREEGDLRPSDRRGAPDISIHALREEGDGGIRL